MGVMEPQGISRVGQTVLARLMELLIWCSVRGGLKGQWPLFTLMPNTSVSSYIPLVTFKLLLWC